MKRVIKFLSVIVCLCFMTTPAFSLITETQQLRFGTFAMRDNNAPHILQILPNGTVNPGAAYIVIADGQEGQYDVSGFPGSTPLIIMASSTPLSIGGCGCGEMFDVINFVALPAAPVTNPAGEASFALGASIRSSGTTAVYTDAAYHAVGTVTVNF